MKRIIFLLSLLLLTNLLKAQDLTGSWFGTLHIQGTKLRVVFHIKSSEQGFNSTMDSPDQRAFGLVAEKTTIDGMNIIIEANKIGMTFKGAFDADSNYIKGSFSQGPVSLSLILLRGEQSSLTKPVARPQDPASFPYKQEEVSFKNVRAGNQLSGTLTIPKDVKASKIVVLISGSGPQDRNEEILQYNHRPFLVWADWLTRNGIAVLRYDDRGVGKSTGIFGDATSADFADDAESAVSYIMSRTDLNKLSIGLLGHSEGGMIAPMIASRNNNVKFIVLLAAPGIPISNLMVQQNKDQMRLLGAPDSIINAAAVANEKIYESVKKYSGLNKEQFKSKIDTFLHAEIQANRLGDSNQDINQQVTAISNQVSAKWIRYFLTVDPRYYLSKVKVPVLALNGTLDMQVASDPNLNGIKLSLEKAGNRHFEVMPLTGLNHLLQKSNTGSTTEYGQLSETVNPFALQKISDWINKL